MNLLMLKNRLLVAFAVGVVVVITMLCFQNVSYKKTRVKSEFTVSTIYFVYTAISILETDYHTNVATVVGTNLDSSVRNKIIWTWIKNDCSKSANEWHINTNTQYALDGWGRPLIFEFKNEIPKTASPRLIASANSNSIAVWSAGPNGTNEWGNNDDVLHVELR